MGHGSVTEKNIYHLSAYIEKGKIAKLGDWNYYNIYFTNKLNANVRKTPLLSPLIYMKSSLQKWKNLEGS